MEAAHRDFLIAVALNLPSQFPAKIGDAGALCDLIDAHGLASRCRRHLTDFRRIGYPDALVAGIERLHSTTQRHYLENLAVLTDIVDEVGEDFGIVIKGFSTYLLTRDEATLRCGDLDVVVRGGRPVLDYLSARCFEQTRASFMHELGEFTKDGVEVDIQSYFPISRYPDGLQTRADGTGHKVRGQGLMASSPLDAVELLQDAVAVDCGSRSVLVPCPEALTLIFAAHSFMNFTNLWSISHREKPWIRLAELADIFELTQLDGFSPHRFSDLVVRHRAENVVAWTVAVCAKLFSRSPFVGMVLPIEEVAEFARMPCCLWWNLWVWPEPPITAQMISRRWYPLPEVLKTLDRGIAWVEAQPQQMGRAGPATAVVLLARLERPELVVSIDCRASAMRPTLRLRIDAGNAATEVAAGWTEGPLVVGSPLDVQKYLSGNVLSLRVDLERANWCNVDVGCFVAAAAEHEGRILASMAHPLCLGGPVGAGVRTTEVHT